MNKRRIFAFLMMLCLIFVFQNCNVTNSFNAETGASSNPAEAASTESGRSNLLNTPSTPGSYGLVNRIPALADGKHNPGFNNTIQNLLIFQIGGWSGLNIGTPGWEPIWPSCGGKKAYLSRNRRSIARQFTLVKKLNLNTAAAILMMPPEENIASGYKTCWNGVTESAYSCNGGEFKHPHELYPEALKIAEEVGLTILPHISLMGWGSLENNPTQVLASLTFMTEKLIKDSATSKAALRDQQGRLVIILEGFAASKILTSSLDPAVKEKFKRDALAYLGSKSNVLWMDILLDDPLNPNSFPANVHHWSFGDIDQMRFRRNMYGNSFSYHASLGPVARNLEQFKATQFSRSQLMETFGILPQSNIFPVIVSQFNEYAEYFIAEPSDKLGQSQFDLLRSILSQQPGSDLANSVALAPITCEDPFLPGVCAPNSSASCLVTNGSGQKMCNSTGTSYGSCIVKSCNTGYMHISGSCQVNQQAVYEGIVKKAFLDILKRTADTVGLAYYVDLMKKGKSETEIRTEIAASPEALCVNSGGSITSSVCACPSGKVLSGGVCKASPTVCTPNSTKTCTVLNGSGTQKCNSAGSAYASCVVTGCNSGYTSLNGSCVRGNAWKKTSDTKFCWASCSSISGDYTGKECSVQGAVTSSNRACEAGTPADNCRGVMIIQGHYVCAKAP